MNVRETPSTSGNILGRALNTTTFMRVGIEDEWVKAQIRINGELFGAGISNAGTADESGSKTAYIHSSGVACN